jgi:hypothetical protein
VSTNFNSLVELSETLGDKMTAKEQIKIIRQILKDRSQLVHCYGCQRDYLPLTAFAQDICPICGHDHNYAEGTDLTALDDYWRDDLELTEGDLRIDVCEREMIAVRGL